MVVTRCLTKVGSNTPGPCVRTSTCCGSKVTGQACSEVKGDSGHLIKQEICSTLDNLIRGVHIINMFINVKCNVMIAPKVCACNNLFYTIQWGSEWQTSSVFELNSELIVGYSGHSVFD